ncbi:MAG: type IV pilus twitching motility protein PilT [bacterium]|nr:type IV pilus twitching motility protein PilT [bacterium]
MEYQKVLNNILETAINSNASDVHIVAGHPFILRICGELVSQKYTPIISPEDSMGLALALMGQERKARFLQEREIDFAYSFSDKARFRVNAFFQMGFVSVALRLIGAKIKTIEELNLPITIKRFAQAEHGLVLITGASSQGKSTTLASLIDEINNTRGEHIITIEDPIEYIFQDKLSLIEQREVRQDTLSFDNALRAALREDPDVIMVGEMRDLETIATTITAAETGHLVFATLHTNSAAQTIHRIIDVFPSDQQGQIRAQLAASLLGIISQKLVPSNGKGFLPACELLFATGGISNLIRENKIHEIPSVLETSSSAGMRTLNKSLLDMVEDNLITRDLAMAHSLAPEDLKLRLGRL